MPPEVESMGGAVIGEREILRNLDNVQRQQLPFATAMALTRTAMGGRESVMASMPDQLDRPTPFTKRGIAYRRATKRNLQAAIFVRPTQEQYLRYQVDGGTRRPSGQAIPVPTSNMRKNAYGNMPKGKVKRLLSNRQKYFSGTPRGGQGGAGIWERVGTRSRRGGQRIRMLVSWESQARYADRPFKFYETAYAAVRRNYARNLRDAVERALRTAR
ncbi:hypothetical protein CAI21_22030 [Alkalilimnicola ehrlichii]|uniref:Uncharacterized protein n=1 Tax=Alkalilimnicola ehrlichii TaxID=351052 RepID=A0A3E0WSH5_9GAMM|nr:hypothetical protein [Alkalilimnicola ehrlichii]RFA24356.1 hypothetical protein CAI21_22030 [Alkalilimnicola ehrlichii]RFA35143.1 hypothetical protein CAL65_13640 [Alkalilimnicola ehrlichii]